MKVWGYILVLLAANALAIEQPDEAELEGLEEAPLELDKFTVTGEGFTFEHELQLRLVRQALKTKKSDKREDKDVWVCWYEMAVGSHRTHLTCARNGDLWAVRPSLQSGGIQGGAIGPPGSGYGTIFRSARATNKKLFEERLAQLPGSNAFDMEFITMAGQGQRPPRDIPTEAELDSFAAAYKQVKKLDRRRADDDTIEAAIQAEGLDLDRYNRIVDLITIYDSLMEEVSNRL